ncbi:alpha/beta fold hydrolase [Paraburkholderia terrae]|uniref:Alpha/beta hydrolase n=1 Tax=Paraburkholderia terrae TaxID=311230 RepID=A0A2I8EQN8_9BURK|nr:alpha/beta hydrolase [Paraburkholderia terrae]AUT61820.1 alpha/beta hydrolase [Paraburkholderia terrae]
MHAFKLTGHGPRKVLLFHGLLGDRDTFDSMLAYADLDAFEYATFDYRGYGDALHAPPGYTLRNVVVDAQALAARLGWTRFAVAGHSSGALVAQMLAVASPDHVDAIVSIAGMNARGTSADPERLRKLDALGHSREMREALVDTGTAHRYTKGFVRALVDATWSHIRADALTGYARDASTIDISRDVAELDAPILVLVGEHDPTQSEHVARQSTLQWYRRAQLDVMAGTGHYPHVETPAATLSLMERFLLAHGAASTQR